MSLSLSACSVPMLIAILFQATSPLTEARNAPINSKYQPPTITFQWWLPEGEENNKKWLLIGDLPDAAKNEIFVDEGNETYTFGDSAWGLSINCSAPYPVEWVPKLNKGLLESSLYSIVVGSDIAFIREFGDINDPSTYKYTSLVKVIRSFKELTGNYSCQSVDGDPSLRKSIFIYVEGENRVQTLILAGKKIEISLEDERVITFPCSVSSPREEITLQKLVQTQDDMTDYEDWKPMAPEETVVFDPKVGFIIQVFHFSPADILGSYRCRGITDADAVYIDITIARKSEREEELNSNSWKVSIQAPASLEYKSLQGAVFPMSTVTCCSKGSKPPSAIGIPCFSINHCRLLDFLEVKAVQDIVLAATFGVIKVNSSCNSISSRTIYNRIVCKGDGIDVDSILVQTYTSYTGAVSYQGKSANSSSQLALISNNDEKDLAEFKKAMVWVSTSTTNSKGNPNPNHPVLADYKKVSDGEIIQVYTNQTITMICSCLNYGLALGLPYSWSINNADQSQTFVLNPILGDDIYRRLRSVLGTSMNLIVTSAEVQSTFTCHCPFAKETGWAKATVSLNLTKSIKPEATVLGETETYWTMNSTDKQLQCKMSGSPKPQVYWKKDGKILNIKPTSRVWNSTYSEDTGIATLRLKKVPTSSHGLYTCVATNFLGTASASINVYVEGVHSTLVYWMSGILIISTCLLLAIVMIKTRKSAQRFFRKAND